MRKARRLKARRRLKMVRYEGIGGGLGVSDHGTQP